MHLLGIIIIMIRSDETKTESIVELCLLGSQRQKLSQYQRSRPAKDQQKPVNQGCRCLLRNIFNLGSLVTIASMTAPGLAVEMDLREEMSGDVDTNQLLQQIQNYQQWSQQGTIATDRVCESTE